MIYINSHIFEVIENPMKVLELKIITEENTRLPSKIIDEAYKSMTLDDLHYITKKIYNEDYYMKVEMLKILEEIIEHYEFESLATWFERYWEDQDKIFIMNELNIEDKNRSDVEYKNTKTIRKFKDEVMSSDLGEDMKKSRLDYLEKENTNLSSRIKKMNANIQRMTDNDYESWILDVYKDLYDYEKMLGKFKTNKAAISHLKGNFDGKTIITEEMIEAAKRVPFNKILKLETIGARQRCKCPFHNEKTASFYVYPDSNRGYCHGCGKSVDTIQYLIEIKNLKFNQAVLTLLSY